MKLEEYGAAKTLSKEINLQMQVECFGKLKSIHRSDLTDFFSRTKSSTTSTEPLGYSKFFHVFF